MRGPDSIRVSLGLPHLGQIEGNWQLTDAQRHAAWEMYIELVTRAPVAEVRPGDGLLRETLTSLYGLFGTTRAILRRYGPDVARPEGDDELSFGYIAVAVLNAGIRPVLAAWHPLLLDFEGRRPAGIPAPEYERSWDRAGELQEALMDARRVLIAYAKLLEQVAGVPSLLIDRID
jgi:hypothetical protein